MLSVTEPRSPVAEPEYELSCRGCRKRVRLRDRASAQAAGWTRFMPDLAGDWWNETGLCRKCSAPLERALIDAERARKRAAKQKFGTYREQQRTSDQRGAFRKAIQQETTARSA